MGKNVFIVWFLLIIVCLFTSCDTYEFPESPYPQVETLPVINISKSGATFHANLSFEGKYPITSHGFVWGVSDNIIIGRNDSIELGEVLNTGEFSYDLKYGLIADTNYYVKAYVKNGEYLVYGQVVSFTSMGSNPPRIDSFSPSEGTWGDTILITGNYFGNNIKSVTVSFGSLNSKVIDCKDSVLKCVVPDNIATKTVPIFVKLNKSQNISATSFVLISPSIASFSPHEGTFDDLVTIIGNKFSTVKEKNVVKFNDHQAQVLEATRTALIVRVPMEIREKMNKISVSVNLQQATSDIDFTVLQPSITSISPNSGLVGGVIQISGMNFNPQSLGNTIRFGGNTCAVQSSTKSVIYFKIPAGIYISRSSPVEVTIAGQSVLSDTLTLIDTWIRKANVAHTSGGRSSATAFSIKGKGYLGLGRGFPGSNFSSYDPKVNLWTEITPFPGANRLGATSFVIGDKAYVGGGEYYNDFWSFDPIAGNWTRIADFTGANTKNIGFSVNGKGYVISSAPSLNFRMYDPVSNTWTAKKDFQITGIYPFYPDAGFVINDRIYVCAADYSTGDNQLWEYNTVSDTWTRKADIRGSSLDYGTTAFTLNGYGYLRGKYDFFKYNPTLDTWTTLPARNNINLNGYYRINATAFVIDNLAYFGTSYEGGSNYIPESCYDLWEFNPKYE